MERVVARDISPQELLRHDVGDMVTYVLTDLPNTFVGPQEETTDSFERFHLYLDNDMKKSLKELARYDIPYIPEHEILRIIDAGNVAILPYKYPSVFMRNNNLYPAITNRIGIGQAMTCACPHGLEIYASGDEYIEGKLVPLRDKRETDFIHKIARRANLGRRLETTEDEISRFSKNGRLAHLVKAGVVHLIQRELEEKLLVIPIINPEMYYNYAQPSRWNELMLSYFSEEDELIEREKVERREQMISRIKGSNSYRALGNEIYEFYYVEECEICGAECVNEDDIDNPVAQLSEEQLSKLRCTEITEEPRLGASHNYENDDGEEVEEFICSGCR